MVLLKKSMPPAGVAQGVWELIPTVHSHFPMAGGPCADSAVHFADLSFWRVHLLCAPAHLARQSLECSWVCCAVLPLHLLALYHHFLCFMSLMTIQGFNRRCLQMKRMYVHLQQLGTCLPVTLKA